MNKNIKIMITICIIVALLSFLGGTFFEDREYISIMEQQQAEYDALKIKYDEFYRMPLNVKTAYTWLDDTIAYHQRHIDKSVSTDTLPLELHQGYIDLYSDIKELFLEFDAEYYK